MFDDLTQHSTRQLPTHYDKIVLATMMDVAESAAQRTLVVRRAIRIAAVYRTHCLVRYGAVPKDTAAVEALRQSARELVRGHPGASRVLSRTLT